MTEQERPEDIPHSYSTVADYADPLGGDPSEIPAFVPPSEGAHAEDTEDIPEEVRQMEVDATAFQMQQIQMDPGMPVGIPQPVPMMMQPQPMMMQPQPMMMNPAMGTTPMGQGYVMQPQMMQPTGVPPGAFIMPQPMPMPMVGQPMPTVMQPSMQPVPMYAGTNTIPAVGMATNGEAPPPQMTYMVAAPPVNGAVMKPKTLDEAVIENMKTYTGCGIAGCNLDSTVMGVSFQNLIVSSVGSLCFCVFCCSGGTQAVVFGMCFVSCCTTLISSLGSSLMLCCGFSNSKHKTGWVTALMIGLGFMLIATIVLLAVFPDAGLVVWGCLWIILIVCNAYCLAHWIRLVMQSQKDIGQPTSYCDC